jgi:SAM-dependent methyltransferase
MTPTAARSASPRRRSPSVRRRAHWERIYRTRSEEELSWHQDEPRRSAELIRTYARPEDRILDAGGGSSSLAERLAAFGFRDVTVVDVAKPALERAAARAGTGTPAVRRVRADLLCRPRLGTFDVWHDRAVFHFLTREKDRAAYLAHLRRCLAPGGLVVVASFALDGPDTCSGLPVARYSPTGLAREFGTDFRLVRSGRELHRTPWGIRQPFSYAVLRYAPRTVGPPPANHRPAKPSRGLTDPERDGPGHPTVSK